MDAKNIGCRLRKLRGTKTMERVANDICVSKSAIAMYERGERIPRDEVKQRLANYYGVPVQTIFFDQIEHI